MMSRKEIQKKNVFFALNSHKIFNFLFLFVCLFVSFGFVAFFSKGILFDFAI